MLTCLKARTAVQDIMRDAGCRFTGGQADVCLYLGQVFVLPWSLLSQHAAARGHHRFQVKPKHHLYEEGLHHAFTSRRNPRSHWLYNHESFVGRVSRIAARTHPSKASLRTLQRWLLAQRAGGAHKRMLKRRTRWMRCKRSVLIGNR